MNLGLGTLTELKLWLLAEELRTETAWDAQIAAIGTGVALAFEKFCNRKFERVVGAQVDFSGDRVHFVLPRYPIEAVTAVELRESFTGSWTDASGYMDQFSALSGLVCFAAEPGSRQSRVRITWTGGYWFDSTEDFSGIKPAGAEQVPADLKLAWLQHCRTVWGKFPKLGTPINITQSAALVTMNFSPEVSDTLLSYRRIQLS